MRLSTYFLCGLIGAGIYIRFFHHVVGEKSEWTLWCILSQLRSLSVGGGVDKLHQMQGMQKSGLVKC